MADEQRRSFLARAGDVLFARSPADNARSPEGRSGTINTRGYLQDDEFNAKLRWPLSLDVWDEMRRTDPTVRWMLALIKMPLRAALWSVEPASPDTIDREAAAFVEHALFEELDGGFDEFLRQALDYLDFGHSLFERVAELRDVEFSYEPGAPAVDADSESSTASVKRQAFVLARLAPRLPRTILRWIPDPRDSSKLAGVQQQLFDGQDPSDPTIDSDRLVVFTHDKEGDDWRGTSLLRPAYKAWRYKTRLENLEAIAYERSAGMPVAYPPDGASDAQVEQVATMLKKMRQGENLWAVMPGPKAGTIQGQQGWLLEEVRVQGDAGASVDGAINRYDGEIARNVLAEFMRLGHENVGARATADVQQDPYYQGIAAYAAYLVDTINAGIVRPLVDWNYSVEHYPQIKVSRIQAKNVQVVFKAVADAVTAGALTHDPEFENYLRELLDAPPMPPALLDASEAAPGEASGAVAPDEGAAPGESHADGNGTGNGRAPMPRAPAEPAAMTVERTGELEATEEQLRAKIAGAFERNVQDAAKAIEALREDAGEGPDAGAE